MANEVQMKILYDKPSIREAIAKALDGDGGQTRVFMTAMNIRDFRLDRQPNYLRKRLSRFLGMKSAVTILIGGPTAPDRFDENLQEFYMYLIDLGANVFFDKRMHAKILLTIGGQESCLLLMSANFTQSGLYDSYEIGTVCDNPNEEACEKLERFIAEKIDRSRPIEYWIGD